MNSQIKQQFINELNILIFKIKTLFLNSFSKPECFLLRSQVQFWTINMNAAKDANQQPRANGSPSTREQVTARYRTITYIKRHNF